MGFGNAPHDISEPKEKVIREADSHHQTAKMHSFRLIDDLGLLSRGLQYSANICLLHVQCSICQICANRFDVTKRVSGVSAAARRP